MARTFVKYKIYLQLLYLVGFLVNYLKKNLLTY